MKISGYKNRKISTLDGDSKVVYDLDMSVTNTTGEAIFGISGFINDGSSSSDSRKLQFIFKSGRVFDPEGRCVYSYQKDTDMVIKGTFLPKQYDYFIDNNLICTKGNKEDFKIRNFFFDSDGCSIVLNDLDIYGTKGSLGLTEDMTFEVFGTEGTSGSSGYGNSSSSGNSGSGDTITFTDALTFNPDTALVGSVLSGQVTLGSDNFAFDNTSSNINYLSDVAGDSTKKDLRLIAQKELARREYHLGIDFHTTFGKIRKTTRLEGVPPENPSGIAIEIDSYTDESEPLDAIFEFKNAGQGEDVSGLYSVIYSANLANIGSPEDVDGLPCKVYLEHVAGDHSKRYSFITGVRFSGNGLGYSTDSAAKQITFRTGDVDEILVAGTAGVDGTAFGLPVTGGDEGVGLISRSASYSSQMVEAHLGTIATNLYTGLNNEAALSSFNIHKTPDGGLITDYLNVADIATIIPEPNSTTAATKTLASGIPQIFNYTKPASDWRLFVGSAGEELEEQTATGSATAPLRYHKYNDDGDNLFLDIAVKAKNYVDGDPMVYRLVASGADSFLAETYITGTAMGTDYTDAPDYAETSGPAPIVNY